MQFGIRLHDAVQAPIEERLKIVKEQGFTCAHVALSKVIHENSVAPEALTPGYAMHLKRMFAKNNLDVAVLGCYLNLANPDPDKLKAIQNKYLANIRFAAQLGAGVVGTETGAPNVEYQFEEACWSEEALEIFIKNLRPVVKYAEQSDIIIKAAAVADYTPVKAADEKIKKKTGDLSIQLKRTADILKYLGGNKREGQFLCGFSMETENLLENSRKKLIDKNADMIIANNLKMAGAGFGTGTNIVTIITKDGYKELGRMDKEDVAICILDEIYKESIGKQ